MHHSEKNLAKQNAPIVYFAFNRPEHTLRTLTAISECRNSENTILHIYIDAPKEGASEIELKKNIEVRNIAAREQWCAEVEIVTAEKNKGLFESIIDGITNTIAKFGKAIVVEDDVLVFPGFLNYMNAALNLYQNHPEVMHISGYSNAKFRDVAMSESTYFYNHTTCWGWATWKRAWDKFTPDALAIKKACAKKGNIHYLNMDGTFEMFWGLKSIANSQFQSWNTLWHSIVFLNDGLCLHPTRSLVNNIGHDGSGTNCELDEGFGMNDFFPDDLVITPIPLIENKTVRDYNTQQYSLSYKLKFAVKHYLRYIFRR